MHRAISRAAGIWMACLAALAVAGACKKSSRSDESAPAQTAAPGEARAGEGKKQVTLQLNWVPEPEFGGFYAAAHAGLYAAQGLDVTIAAGAAGIQTWKMVATGKVPFAIASAGEVIRARLQDADIVALYAVYQTNPQAIMVHQGSGVSSLEEVFTSGKIARVAMEAGLPYGRFLEKRYGFDKVSVVQYSGNLTMFLQDPTMAQQCFVFSEPVSAREQGVTVETFSIAESGFNPYLAVVITSEAFLKEQPEVVAGFVRASRAGWQAYLDDPEPANQYMKEQKAAMTLSAMKLAATLQAPYVVTGEGQALGHMDEARWRELATQLHSLGEIEQVPAEISSYFRNIE